MKNQNMEPKQVNLFDILNNKEIACISKIQKTFFTELYFNIQKKIQYISSYEIKSLLPLFLFCIGLPVYARQMVISLFLYKIIITLLKKYLYRRRPNAYSNVYFLHQKQSSSFPSRTSILISLILAILPMKFLPVQIILILILNFGSCIFAYHFPSDILFGSLLGFFIHYIGIIGDNQIFALILFGINQFFLPDSTPVNASLLPFLILKCDGSSWPSFWIPFVKYLFSTGIRRQFHMRKATIQSFILEFFTVCFLMFTASSFSLYILKTYPKLFPFISNQSLPEIE